MKWESGRWYRPCEFCIGEGCDECLEGWIQEESHPRDLLTNDARDLFQAYRMLKDYGTFPIQGGWLVQTEKFLRAMDVCDKSNGLFRNREAKKEESDRKLKEELQKVMDRGI